MRKRTHEEYVELLKNKNSNIIPLEKYIDANTRILHKCLVDGNKWYVTPSSLLNGYGCPKCNSSRGEKAIEKWLKDRDVEFIPQKTFEKCKDKKVLPFDFYLSKYNKCIEYDGEQHFRPIEIFGGEEGFKTRQLHDQMKNEYCEKNGIELLRIPYYANIEEELEKFLCA